jgi:1-acyl-sn-glycerol-3-phosphate acyltransferase
MAKLTLAAVSQRLTFAARQAGRWLYAAWCWGVFALLGLPVAALLALLQHPAAGRRLGHAAARLFLLLAAMPVRAQGLERLPGGPHLLLANHTSYFDMIALYAALPPGRGYAFVAKRELVRQPFIHACLRGLGTLFVERYEAAKSAEDVAELAARLGQGGSLVVFPEGTFSREAGLKPFRHGRLRRRGARRRAGGGGRAARRPRDPARQDLAAAPWPARTRGRRRAAGGRGGLGRPPCACATPCAARCSGSPASTIWADSCPNCHPNSPSRARGKIAAFFNQLSNLMF